MYISSSLLLVVICGVFFCYLKFAVKKHPFDKNMKIKHLSKKKINYFRDNNLPSNKIHPDYYDYLWRECYKKVWYTYDYNSRFAAQAEFVNNLNLCVRLYYFIQDIQHYTNWFEEGRRRDFPFVFNGWYSEEISSNCLKKIKCNESSQLKLFTHSIECADDDELLEYSFSSGIEQYVMLILPEFTKYNSYYPVIIFEKKEKTPQLCLFVELYTQKNGFDKSIYHYKLAEFREDDWVKSLLYTMFKVHIKEKIFSEIHRECKASFKRESGDVNWYQYDWGKCKDMNTYSRIINAKELESSGFD